MKARSLFSVELSNGNNIKVKAYSKQQAKFLVKSLYGLEVDISMIKKATKPVNRMVRFYWNVKDAYKHEADICSGLVDP